MSLADDVSGLGSTRVVRSGVSMRRRHDDPDEMATGTQDGEVSRCAGALRGEAFVGDGCGGAAGDVGAELPALAPALRGGGA